jgi:CCR4-NOT transcription complex subunit 7/8
MQDHRELHEIWAGNFDEQFESLLHAVKRAGGSEAILSLDMEFPGFLCPDPQYAARAVHYQALRYNVDKLWPIQFGVAVSSSKGQHEGVWTFNLRFDVDVDPHSDESISFLKDAGIDFPRHRTQGVNAAILGKRLAESTLVGPRGPRWLTFSGSYDWAYLLKLVTLGRPLPALPGQFDQVLAVYCPNRKELRDLLPTGSLEVLGKRYGVRRWGAAHTAGSDALLTLELSLVSGIAKLEPKVRGKTASLQNWDRIWQPDGEYLDGGDYWETTAWENNHWSPENWANNSWFLDRRNPHIASAWHPSALLPWWAI